MKFLTVRVSWNLNLMKSFSTKCNQQLIGPVFSKVMNVWNKTLENKLIAKDHQVQSK